MERKYHLYEEQRCWGQGTNYSGHGTKIIIYMWNRHVGGKEQNIAMME
jgi:hypothetical protein